MPSIAEKEKIKVDKATEKARLQEEKAKVKAEKAAEKQRLKDEKAAERKRQSELKTAEKLKLQKEKESERLKLQQERLANKERVLQEKTADKQRQQEEKLSEKLRIEQEKKNEEERNKQQFLKFFKKLDKVSNALASTSAEVKSEKADILSQTFIIRKDMKLAPPRLRNLSEIDILSLEEALSKQNSTTLYLQELKDKIRLPHRMNSRGALNKHDSADILIVNVPTDKYESRRTYRTKLLQFWENCRPPYYGTWRQTCYDLRHGRRPFSRAYTEFDYDFDSEAEWEEEPIDADECKSEDEDSAASEEEDDEDGFIVEHGYLSSDEEEKASREEVGSDNTLDAESRRNRMKVKAEAWKAEKLCKKWEKLKPICVVNPTCSLITTKPLEVHYANLFKSLEAVIVEPLVNSRTPQNSSASTKGCKRRNLTDMIDKRTKMPKCNLIEAYCTPISIKSRKKLTEENVTPQKSDARTMTIEKKNGEGTSGEAQESVGNSLEHFTQTQPAAENYVNLTHVSKLPFVYTNEDSIVCIND